MANVAKTLGPASEDRGSSKTSPAGMVVGILMVTMAAIAAGGIFGLQLQALVLETVQRKDDAAPVAEPSEIKPTFSEPASVRALPTVITNLAGPQGAWVRIEGSIVLPGEPASEDGVLAAKIAEDIVAFLRTVSASDIEGASGFQNLREDLDERVRVRSNGRVRDLIIHTFIVE